MRIEFDTTIYKSPQVEVLEMTVEKGFSASPEIGNEILNENEGIW